MKQLYILTKNDLKKASLVLGNAFYDYPIFAYVLPDARERERTISTLMRFLLNCGLLHGEVVAPSKDLEGVSIWYKSDELDFPFRSLIRAGFFRLLFSVQTASLKRFSFLGTVKEQSRKSLMKEPYIFLDMIGVDPARQSNGHGGLMIEHGLQRCDRERLPCYLETCDERNIGYYRQYGFEETHEYTFDTLTSFCMVRKTCR